MEFSENELVSMICDNDEDVKAAIYEKYAYIIDIILFKYRVILHKLNIDKNDIKQEALIAFNNSLITYNYNKNASLPTYITVVIARRIHNFFRQKSLKIKKDIILINSLKNEQNVMELIPDNKYNPERIIDEKTNYDNLVKEILISLSPKEKDIFYLLINNFKCTDISKILKINLKQVYNAVHRIKDKAKSIIDNY